MGVKAIPWRPRDPCVARARADPRSGVQRLVSYLVGGGTPFFTALDNWVNLNLVETRTFPDGVLLTRYETRR